MESALKFMRRAMHLAEQGRGFVSPNPLVGAVLVKKGRIVSEGAHRYFGGPHAEVTALHCAGRRARGSDLYVTLEPCSTHGKTGPCTEAIKKSGVRRVFIGVHDPNPRHAGRGVRLLKKAGIPVRTGFLTEELSAQNAGFFSWVTRRRPYVILKLAQSLDGKIATASGESRWITSEETRRRVHVWRSSVDALLVGTGTILKDDPSLTVRGVAVKRQPARVVLDRSLNLSPKARVFKSNGARVILFTTAGRLATAGKKFSGKHMTIRSVRVKNGRLDLKEVFRELAKLGITSVLAEGGGVLAAALIKERLADKLIWCIAPIVIGGERAKSAVAGAGVSSLKQAPRLKRVKLIAATPDLVLEGEL